MKCDTKQEEVKERAMGAHHSQDQKDAENSGHGSERGSRRGSEAEKQPQTSMVPVEKLSKVRATNYMSLNARHRSNTMRCD